MTQLKDGGRQPSNREERSLSASTVIARWQGNGWDEPCKSRGLRTVLWAAGGEIPPADPAAWNPTYVPMARGFVYLAAVIDWFSRRVLAWRLSITQEAAYCVEALEDALARHGRPEVFNTDQGSQFTSHAFTGVLLKAGIAISMDGKGSWRDNVFVERLWRSIKYEEVYLRAYETVSDARASIGRYLAFYNGRRPHSSLDRQTPDRATSIGCRNPWQPEP